MIRCRIVDNVNPTAAIMTDDWPGHKDLRVPNLIQSVNHSKGESVRQGDHTNTIEGAWSLFKRQVIGIHHHISAQHINSYLIEMCYRYN